MKLNLRRLGLLSGRAARVFAARAKLTPQRVDLMLLLRSYRLNHTELAERLCVSRPVVSRMLHALVTLGLVCSHTDERDSRARIPRLTQSGFERLARCFPNRTRRGAQDVGERI